MFHPQARKQFVDPKGSLAAFRSLWYFYQGGSQGYVQNAKNYVRSPTGKHPSLQIHIAGSEVVVGWGALTNDIVTFDIVTSGDQQSVFKELNNSLGIPHYPDDYYPISLCCPDWNNVPRYYMRTRGLVIESQHNAGICESILRLPLTDPDMDGDTAESLVRQLWDDILAEPVLRHVYPLLVVASGHIGSRKIKRTNGVVDSSETEVLELHIIGVYSIPNAVDVCDWFKIRFPGSEHTHHLFNFLGNLNY